MITGSCPAGQLHLVAYTPATSACLY